MTEMENSRNLSIVESKKNSQDEPVEQQISLTDFTSGNVNGDRLEDSNNSTNNLEVLEHEEKEETEKSILLTNLLYEHLNHGYPVDKVSDKKDFEKYEETLEHFRKIYKQSNLLDRQIRERVSTAKAQKQEAANEVTRLCADLTNAMFETGISLTSAGQILPEKIVSKVIDRFTKIQKQISSKRLEFIITQNALMKLKLKEKNLDELGGGYKMPDYENLLTEVQEISSNIDVKHERLDAMRRHLKSNLRQIKMTKEKFTRALESNEKQKTLLDSLKKEENILRIEVNELEMQKKHLRAKCSELEQKAGILNRGPLMRNFDDVTEEIEEFLKKIHLAEGTKSELAAQADSLKMKISKLDKKEADNKHLNCQPQKPFKKANSSKKLETILSLIQIHQIQNT